MRIKIRKLKDGRLLLHVRPTRRGEVHAGRSVRISESQVTDAVTVLTEITRGKAPLDSQVPGR